MKSLISYLIIIYYNHALNQARALAIADLERHTQCTQAGLPEAFRTSWLAGRQLVTNSYPENLKL